MKDGAALITQERRRQVQEQASVTRATRPNVKLSRPEILNGTKIDSVNPGRLECLVKSRPRSTWPGREVAPSCRERGVAPRSPLIDLENSPLMVSRSKEQPAPHGLRSLRTSGGADEVGPWPWSDAWDKRKKHDRIRQLSIAGALIAAEINRLLAAKGGETDVII